MTNQKRIQEEDRIAYIESQYRRLVQNFLEDDMPSVITQLEVTDKLDDLHSDLGRLNNPKALENVKHLVGEAAKELAIDLMDAKGWISEEDKKYLEGL